MDERKQHIHVVLVLFMVINMCVSLLTFEQIVMNEHNDEMTLMAVFILEGGQIYTLRTLWKHARVSRYIKQNLLRSFLENMF